MAACLVDPWAEPKVEWRVEYWVDYSVDYSVESLVGLSAVRMVAKLVVLWVENLAD